MPGSSSDEWGFSVPPLGKVGIKNKRLAAALDDTYLEKVLVGT